MNSRHNRNIMEIKNKQKEKKLTHLLDKELKLRKQLEDYLDLCPFAKICAESNYGDEEICRNDYEACKNYSLFKERKT